MGYMCDNRFGLKVRFSSNSSGFGDAYILDL